MRARIGSLVVVMLVLATLVWALAAQNPLTADRGTLAGTISDASGAVLPGVTVEVTGPMKATAVTDGRGAFRILDLIPGDYTLTATLAGFTTAVTQATVTRRLETNVAFAMHVGALTETITVTGHTPSVVVQSTRRSVVVGGQAAARANAAVGAGLAAAPSVAQAPMEFDRRAREHGNTGRTSTSTTTRSSASRTIRCRRSRWTSIPRPTPTCAGSSTKGAFPSPARYASRR